MNVKISYIQVVNSAGCCVFAAVGASKADMMKKLVGPDEPEDPLQLPARLVRPVSGELIWFLDQAAAQKL